MKFVKTLREVSIDYIQKVVSDYFQMDIETLQSKTRRRHIVQARQLAILLKFLASLASIGIKLVKGHATVLHACKTVDNLTFTDKQFQICRGFESKTITLDTCTIRCFFSHTRFQNSPFIIFNKASFQQIKNCF